LAAWADPTLDLNAMFDGTKGPDWTSFKLTSVILAFAAGKTCHYPPLAVRMRRSLRHLAMPR
jgi:hypothetical protein